MIAELWTTVASGQETTLKQRARCRLAAVYAADCAREVMDLMYRHSGSTLFKRESRLAERWRHLPTVGQTVILARMVPDGRARPSRHRPRPAPA